MRAAQQEDHRGALAKHQPADVRMMMALFSVCPAPPPMTIEVAQCEI